MAPPVPSLANPTFLALKSALASGVALVACAALGNEDRVSAAFVAVLCVAPTVWIGVRRSLFQLAGSLLGGLFGAAAAWAGLPPHVGIPVAVGLATLASFVGGMAGGTVVAAFTAIVVQAVPRGLPDHTLEVRLEAVGIAVAAAFVVNLAVSGASYRTIFARRLARVEAYLPAALTHAADAGPEALQPAFGLVATLLDELGVALEELGWRRSPDEAPVRAVRDHLRAWRHLLHVVVDAQTVAAPGSVADLVRWAARGQGEAPPAPDGVRARVIAARAALDARP